MHKYATATALAITLTITMLTPAVSGPPRWMPRHEIDCDSSAKGLPGYAIRCHCSFECSRQIGSYTVTLPCSGWGYRPGFVTKLPNGLCDVRVVPEAYHACEATCVNAKQAAQH
jgi:hypothetical protein